MASPTPFDRQTSFAQFSAQFPEKPQNGASLDAEFNAVKVALDETQSNLNLLQDAEGQLRAGVVGREQLDASILLGFAAPTSWTTGVLYTADISTVFRLGIFYIATVTHTSGVSFDSAKWRQLADLTAATAIDDLSITEAKLASNSVTTSKIGALQVTEAKLASNSVTASKIPFNSIPPTKATSAAAWQAFILPAGLGPLPWSGSTAPPGWLLAGGTYNRADYPALWAHAQAEISGGNTLFGAGDGLSTFTIKNLAGLAHVALDPASITIPGATFLGAVTGESTHTLLRAELPAVAPAFTGTGSTIEVTSTVNDIVRGSPTPSTAGNAGAIGTVSGGTAGAITSSVDYTPAGTIANLGSGAAHNNVQPSVTVNYIYKAH